MRPARGPRLVQTGDSLTRVDRYTRVLVGCVVGVVEASVVGAEWLGQQCHKRSQPAEPSHPPGAQPANPPRPPAAGADLAPATVRRYAQAAQRFTRWLTGAGGDGSGTVARFLTEATGPARGPRSDPLHLGLARTTICALRSALARADGRQLAVRVRLPPRPRPVAAATRTTVRALWRTARRGRERLVLTLCCGLGLRPGQMVTLRWSDVDLRGACSF